MAFDPLKHHRRSVRLPGYNYGSTGLYFLTICTHRRSCILGHVDSAGMHLSEPGRIVQSEWDPLSERFSEAHMDAFVIMPNHIHAIVVIGDKLRAALGTGYATSKTGVMNHAPTLGAILRSLKAVTTHRIRGANLADRVWPRNYYDHVIRNERELSTIRVYIEHNPLFWQWDANNPELALIRTQPSYVGEPYGFTEDETRIVKEILGKVSLGNGKSLPRDNS